MFSFSSFISYSLHYSLHSSLLSVSLSHSPALFLSHSSCAVLHSPMPAHCLIHFLRCGLSLSCALLWVLSLYVLLLILAHSLSCSCSLAFPCLHDLSYTHSLSHLCSRILILFLSPVHCMSLSLLFSHSSQTYCILFFLKENMRGFFSQKVFRY